MERKRSIQYRVGSRLIERPLSSPVHCEVLPAIPEIAGSVGSYAFMTDAVGDLPRLQEYAFGTMDRQLEIFEFPEDPALPPDGGETKEAL
jgi:hypothetical protein